MTEPYCEVMEMTAAWCAHCTGDTLTEEEIQEAELSPWFSSQWPGVCSTCREPFERGTTIRRDSRGWQADCCRNYVGGMS